MLVTRIDAGNSKARLLSRSSLYVARPVLGAAALSVLATVASAAGAGADDLVDRLTRLEAGVPQPAAHETHAAPAETLAAPARSPASDRAKKKSSGPATPHAAAVGAPPASVSIEERLSRLEALAASGAQAPAQQPAASGGHADAAHGAAPTFEFNDLRPTIRSADGRNELSVRGLMQADAAAYIQDPGDMGPGVSADHADLGSGAIMRKARVGVEGKFMDDFIYEMRFEFGGADSESGGTIDVMRVGYVGIPNMRIHLGVLQPVMTMAESTSSSELLFLERPSVVGVVASAFGGKSGRRGVEATYQKEGVFQDGDNLVISAALTGGTVGTGHGGTGIDDEVTNLLGRAAYRVYADKDTNIQIGTTLAEVVNVNGAGSPGGAAYIKFRDRPETGVSGEYLVEAATSSSGIRAQGASLAGLEAGMNVQNLFLGGEWYEFDVDRDASAYDPSFSGWYVEGSWIITGEHRRYVASAYDGNLAVWAGPKVKKPLGAGGIGVIEAVGRYSVLDLNWNEGAAGAATPAGGIRGGEQSIFSLGLIWYLNNNLRLMTDYQWVDVDRLNGAGDDAGQQLEILQGRVQFKF